MTVRILIRVTSMPTLTVGATTILTVESIVVTTVPLCEAGVSLPFVTPDLLKSILAGVTASLHKHKESEATTTTSQPTPDTINVETMPFSKLEEIYKRRAATEAPQPESSSQTDHSGSLKLNLRSLWRNMKLIARTAKDDNELSWTSSLRSATNKYNFLRTKINSRRCTCSLLSMPKGTLNRCKRPVSRWPLG